jgi:hypothetical protein
MMIKPPWALSIWHDSDYIYMELPGTGKRHHNLKVPHSIEGMHKILALLQARDAQYKIGTPASPTQDQINHIHYSLNKPKRKAKFEMSDAEYKSTLAICKLVGLV